MSWRRRWRQGFAGRSSVGRRSIIAVRARDQDGSVWVTVRGCEGSNFTQISYI